MNKDYNRIMRKLDDKAVLDQFFTRVFIAFLSFLSIVLMFTTLKLASASTEEINSLRVELVQNLAISEDAASYMVTHGKGLIFSDMDVE